METEKKPLKLNVKRTFVIGFAFFGILMLWQVYNTYCPLFLTATLVNKYHGDKTDYQYIVGVLMALDNLVALAMLPLFGAWSDKTHTKFGKRMPFIVIGCILLLSLTLGLSRGGEGWSLPSSCSQSDRKVSPAKKKNTPARGAGSWEEEGE